MLDIILQAHRNITERHEFWKKQTPGGGQGIDLGKWEVVYNEAAGYNVLE